MSPSITSQDYFISWDEFHRDCLTLAKQLTSRPWQGIIAITRGGLVPAAILARELDLRIVDTFCIASYQHTQQGSIQTLKTPAGDGKGFLLVDDLVDSGNTARVARQQLPKTTFACVYAKPKGRELSDYFTREFSQDTWIHFPWDSELRYREPLINAGE